ncbi:K(+)/H(+) antiporter NhaP [Thermus thermophilus]|uniref:K(+)/H(+) antiporter NhaP n=1 Tax=Thermus thermophilus TaxID=274 RepID=A0A3P4ARA8_THETH|nr:potassium/proton antiporter [Thermus thermophilus]VCU53079.1 K(+)/H(+) antiporter NhaP [Thermus thermophilus]
MTGSPADIVLFGSSVLLLLSILLNRVSERFGIPPLLLFLVLGMLAGSDGPGGIYFDDTRLAQGLGVMALAFILFAGGLDTVWSQIRPVFWPGLVLATLGVILTAWLVGIFASLVLGFPPPLGFLLGAIVSSTDAAAVFSVLRARGVRLRERLKALLELESGTNDPMAVLLTVGLTAFHLGAGQPGDLVWIGVKQLGLGLALGYLLGRATAWAWNRFGFQYRGLRLLLSFALVLFTYGFTAVLGGSGFAAVYLAGLVVGSVSLKHKDELLLFHDGVAWIMQTVMFLVLGLLVFPSQLPGVVLQGTLVALFLMFVARPLAVALCLLPFRWSWREVLLVGWVGLRGAVPIVLATYPLLAGVPGANTLFNLVFFVVLLSVALQGPTLGLLAHWLGLEEKRPDALPS